MRQKRVNSNNSILKILIISILILGLCFFGFKKISYSKKISNIKEVYSKEINPTSDKKNAGKLNSTLKYDLDHVVAVHYPTFDNDKIDPTITTYANTFVDNFNSGIKDLSQVEGDNPPVVYLDYESGGFKDNFVSLKFFGYENIPSTNQNKEFSDFFVYDLKTGEVVSLDDLVIEQALPVLATFVGTVDNTIVEPTFENFNKFLIKETSISFFIDNNGELKEYSMELNDLDEYSKYDFKTGEKLSEEALQEKIDAVSTHVRDTIDPNKPMIALTFDDGPYRNITTPILDILEKHNAVATFFVLGTRVPTNEDILQRALDGGSEIANHSFNHKQLNAISLQELNNQINNTQAAVKNAVGIEPTLLRPTYGAINDTMRNNVKLPMILWSIDTLDWKHKNTQRIVNHVLSNARDGDIVLMHDMYPTTNQATQILVPELINRGFQLVTITELYELKGIPLEAGKTYTNVR